MDRADEEDVELSEWVDKPGKGVAARIRGVEARIAKVRKELRSLQKNCS